MPAFDQIGTEAVVKNMEGYVRDLRRMAEANEETAKQIGDSAKSSKLATSALTIMGGVYQKVGHMAVDFVRQLPGMAVQFIQLGAAVQRQTAALDSLARTYDTSADDIVASIQRASSFTIDRMTAMSAANRAMIFDVAKTPAEFERLATVAVTLGRAMGRTAVQSIDDFVIAAGRQSIMIADNLGLIIRQKELQDDVNRIMRETPGITESAAKKQAFLNEMLRAGEGKVAALGGATTDTATGIAAVTTAVTDARVEFAEMAADVFSATVNTEKLAEAIRELPDALREFFASAEELERIVEAENEDLAATVTTFEEYEEAAKAAGLITWEAAEAIRESAESMDEAGRAAYEMAGVTDVAAVKMSGLKVAMSESEFIALKLNEAIIAQEIAARAAFEPQEELVTVFSILDDKVRQMGQAYGALNVGMAEATRIADAQKVALIDLAARMMDVTAVETARIAIEKLKEAQAAGQLTADEYVAAVTRIQLSYGLATEESIRLAGELDRITAEFAEGTIGEYAYDAALKAILDDLPPTTAELSEMTKAQQEATREAERLAEEARNAAAATGDELVAMLGDATAETDIFALALFESADAAGADADLLAVLAGTLGIYTDAEIEAALAAVTLQKSIEELGVAIAEGTMTMEEAIAAMHDVVATLPAGISVYERSAGAHRSVAGANREEADARRAAERAARDATRAAEAEARELERLVALTGDYFSKALDSSEITDEWALAMYEAADAIGVSAEELALLAGALDLYTEEQVEAALAAAALQVQIAELAEEIAKGMGIDEAVEKFEAFRQELGLLPTVTMDLSAEIASLTREYNEMLRAGAGGAVLAGLLTQIRELELMVTPAQYGFRGMVGPGYGGPRLFMAGERPEYVNISPISAPAVMGRQATVNMGPTTVNNGMDVAILRQLILQIVQEAVA